MYSGNKLVAPKGTVMRYKYDSDFEGAMPLDHPQLGRIVEPDEVVVRAPEVRCLFNYPMSVEHVTMLRVPEGAYHFTRKALVGAICDEYQRIYNEESEGSSGIWGHVLGDLVLHEVSYSKENDALCLGVDSEGVLCGVARAGRRRCSSLGVDVEAQRVILRRVRSL
jgi:hypothetical protein